MVIFELKICYDKDRRLSVMIVSTKEKIDLIPVAKVLRQNVCSVLSHLEVTWENEK